MKMATKILAVLMAALMLMTCTAFAAGSKEDTVPSQTTKTGKSGEWKGYTKTKKATFIRVIKSKRATLKSKKIPKTYKKDGITFTVNKIAKNAFAGCKKLRTVKVYCTKAPSVAKGAFGKLNTSKITIKVTKKMKAKQYKLLKSRFRKAGFKGKFARL